MADQPLPDRIALDPQPHFAFGVSRIVRVPDPFHNDALAGTPGEGQGAGGERLLKWYCEDFAGNLVAEWHGGYCPFGADAEATIEHVRGKWMWVRKGAEPLPEEPAEPVPEAPDAGADPLEVAFWRFDALYKAHYRDADPALPGPMTMRDAFKRVVSDVAAGAKGGA